MNPRNTQSNNRASEFELAAHQMHNQQHPEPYILLGSTPNFPQPQILLPPGPISNLDGTALYRLPQYAPQMHPVANPELGIPGPSAAFYNPYLVPVSGTGMFSHPAMDQLPSSSYGATNFPPNAYRGSSKRNEPFPATPSTMAMSPMNVGHFDAGVTILDACYPLPEFRGNNYIGQPCRPPTSTWSERPPMAPYFEVSNINGGGSQNLPHYTPMLHPPQLIPHYRPQPAANSTRHPFSNRMQYSSISHSQQGPEAVPPSSGLRIYRSHRSGTPEGIHRHPNLPHLRLLEEGVAILEFSGHYEMSNAVDHHRDMRLDIDYMSYEELLALSERIGTVKTGLSEDVITAYLKTRVYRSAMASIDLEQLPCSDEINDSCVICQEEYEDNDMIGITDCGHEYHDKCLKKWLPLKNTCPICKSTALKEDQKKKKSGQIQ